MALPQFRASYLDGVVTIENLGGQAFGATLSVGTPNGNGHTFVVKADAIEATTAVLLTRVDGIDYFQFEGLTIEFGEGADIVNVQSTTLTTQLNLNGGDDKAFVSSLANVTLS